MEGVFLFLPNSFRKILVNVLLIENTVEVKLVKMLRKEVGLRKSFCTFPELFLPGWETDGPSNIVISKVVRVAHAQPSSENRAIFQSA